MISGPAISLAATVIPNFGRADNCLEQNHPFCWSWFSSHWGDTFQPALIQHIVLTLIAVAIGFVIALALALLARSRGWLTTPIIGVTSLLYTIPSLALFEILIPITGLTRLTIEIALVSYTLLILFRNISIGLNEVPAEVREAARGMGFNSRQILWRVEFPLALPAIIAGVRTATVTVISLATVAGLVIAQGLGFPIFRGLQVQLATQYFAGGLVAVLLALVADGLLVLAQRFGTPWARTRRV